MLITKEGMGLPNALKAEVEFDTTPMNPITRGLMSKYVVAARTTSGSSFMSETRKAAEKNKNT